MAHEDSGWRPKGATESYDGFEVWDHGVWPNEYNHGDAEPDHAHDHEEDHDEDDEHERG